MRDFSNMSVFYAYAYILKYFIEKATYDFARNPSS